MLQLRHVFLGRRFFRERPGQHELGFKDSAGRFDTAVERCSHPSQRRMPDLPLDVREHLTGIGLVPVPVQVLGRYPKLDNQVAGQVLGLDLAPLYPPQAQQGSFVVAHNDPSVRSTDEVAPISGLDPDRASLCPGLLRGRLWVRLATWGRNGISLGQGLPPWLGLELGRSVSSRSARDFQITENINAVNS
jgi:hypothetical protein